MIERIEKKEEKMRIAASVLEGLPEWFGIPESTREYVKESAKLPFWACVEGAKPLGFAVMKETSPYTAELYVMGVRREYHGLGLGRKLFDALYSYAKEKGFLFLQVKTVRAGCFEEYDRTGAFYRKLGFKELECIPEIWGDRIPCQIYIMNIV